MSPYEVRLAPAAVRAFKKLSPEAKARVRGALEKLAGEVAKPGRIGGKRVKSIQGARDTFHRLRVGEHRVMYDVLAEERTVLILGVVHRGDLERWIRNR
ncbi:MAG TPA: type II toxin-antitoxin system RelE/ParE family toxin [Actinomycetota bacterium]|nr:type II toxin-antitoxin system RelE/ParE family toxin [Actinomycetota bacterium]